MCTSVVLEFFFNCAESEMQFDTPEKLGAALLSAPIQPTNNSLSSNRCAVVAIFMASRVVIDSRPTWIARIDR